MSAKSLTFDGWSDRLTVAPLKCEDITGANQVDMIAACNFAEIEANEDWLIRYLNENDNKLGSGAGMFSLYSFSLSPVGREHARKLIDRARPRTLVERLTEDTSQKLINVGNFAIAIFALIVAALALWNSN